VEKQRQKLTYVPHNDQTSAWVDVVKLPIVRVDLNYSYGYIKGMGNERRHIINYKDAR
jgi:hypothetical protein